MNEELDLILDEACLQMDEAVLAFENALYKIRAGKANPAMLGGIVVDYFGSRMPINQLANVSAPDARTLMVQAWDKNALGLIEKEIMKANLGFTPTNTGEFLRITVPALTEDRRKSLTKQVKTEGEHFKVTIRNARRDANEEVKKLKKDGLEEDIAKDFEAKIQKTTDAYIVKIDTMIVVKEKDILTV